MSRYFGNNEDFHLKERRAPKRQKFESFDNDDVGIVHYQCSKGLRSPPGYSPKQSRRRPSDSGKITLNEGSLFKMCLKFMALNIDLLDSLVGLPDIIGEQLFSALVHHGALVFQLDSHGQLTANDRTKTKVLGLFDEAYHELVLRTLTMEGVPEKMDIASLVTPFRNLVELDLSNRVLTDHMVSQLSKFYCLEKLVLRNNELNDESVVKLTRPYRVFTDNPQELEVLDLRGNIGITNRSLEPLLSVFTKLKALNLTGTSAVIHQCTTYELKQFGWRRASDTSSSPVQTEGWATPIFTHLQNKRKSDEMKTSQKAAKFYLSKKNQMKESDGKTNVTDLVLTRDAIPQCTSKLSKEALLGVERTRKQTKSFNCSNLLDEPLDSLSESPGGSRTTKAIGKTRKLKIKPRAVSSSFFQDEDEKENDDISHQYTQCGSIVKRKGLLECLDDA